MSKGEKIVYAIVLIFFVWMMLSFFDVITHNIGDESYSKFNMFVLFFKSMRN